MTRSKPLVAIFADVHVVRVFVSAHMQPVGILCSVRARHSQAFGLPFVLNIPRTPDSRLVLKFGFSTVFLGTFFLVPAFGVQIAP